MSGSIALFVFDFKKTNSLGIRGALRIPIRHESALINDKNEKHIAHTINISNTGVLLISAIGMRTHVLSTICLPIPITGKNSIKFII